MSADSPRLIWLKFLSTVSLLLERLTLAFWRLACWCMGFAALWLFEIPAALGQSVSVITLIIAIAGAAHFTRQDTLKFKWPSRKEIERRIEQESGVQHRPLSSAQDKPIKNTDTALWTREQLRKLRVLDVLKAPYPRALLPLKDPRALRFAVLLAFICGIFVAGGDWPRRMHQGLVPVQLAEDEGIQNESVSLWITPPEYTKAQRILPETGSDEVLKIPQGSVLKAIVKQDWRHFLQSPTISIDDQIFAMNAGEDAAYTIEQDVPKGEALGLRSGLFKTDQWAYEFIPDMPPLLAVIEEPKVLSDAKIQFTVGMIDDYGVQTLNMRMMLDPAVKDAPPGWAVHEQRSVLSPPRQEFQMSPVYDLAAHPWAGLPVVFSFIAHDHIDQIAQSKLISMTLPERIFRHPVAQKLVGIRKDLLWKPEAPYRQRGIDLINILSFPHTYGHNTRIFLALRVATSRLFYNEPSVETSQSVAALLWDVALQLEDGDLSLAARALRTVQMDLERALQNPNTSEAEIASLMNELRQAMAEYMQAMAREFQKRVAEGREMPLMPPGMMNNMVGAGDLAAMLDKMEAEMMAGDRGAAQDMLSKLQRLLDMTGGSMETQLPPDMQMMQEGMNELRELVERQETLRGETEKQAEMIRILAGLGVDDHNKDAPPPFINTEEHEDEQEALRAMLEDLISRAELALDEVPESLGLAAVAMQESAAHLAAKRPDRSLPAQDEALEHLKNAQQQMAQQMAQRMQQMTGLSFGGRSPMRLDPLGRPMGDQEGQGGDGFGSQVKIPSEAEQKRVRDILNELRRRASQRDRPPEELDYYRRLLKRF